MIIQTPQKGWGMGEKLIVVLVKNCWQIRDDGCLYLCEFGCVCVCRHHYTYICARLSELTCEGFLIWEDWLCHYGGIAVLGWSPLVTLQPLQCRCLSPQDGLLQHCCHFTVYRPATLPVRVCFGGKRLNDLQYVFDSIIRF